MKLFSSFSFVTLIFSLLIGILVFLPVGSLFLGSLWSGHPGYEGEWTLNNYIEAFNDPTTPKLLINSLVYAAGSALVAVFLAVFYALLTTRTDTPGREVLSFLSYIDLMTPALLTNLGWIYLLDSRVGLINNFLVGVFGSGFPVIEIYSFPGMIFVTALNLFPLTYLAISAAFRAMNQEFEDAARVCGGGFWNIAFNVTLRLTMPAILSIMLLDFIIVMEVFETPSMIGLPAKIPVFMSMIYRAVSWSVPPKVGEATALAIILLLITIGLVTIYRWFTRHGERYVLITGRGYNPSVISLGKWRYMSFLVLMGFILFFLFLPIIVVFLLSLKSFWNPRDLFSALTMKNYMELTTHPTFVVSIFNSAMFAAIAATILVFLILFTVYLSRRLKVRGMSSIDSISMLPQAYPGLILALGLLWAYISLPIGIYGTAAILIIAYVTKFMPHIVRLLSGVIMQIHHELEEASRVVGASMLTTIRKVVIPLLKPALISAWIYSFIVSFREVSASVLLVSPKTEVVSVVLWELWVNGDDLQFAAAVIILVAIQAAVLSISMLISRLLGMRLVITRRTEVS